MIDGGRIAAVGEQCPAGMPSSIDLSGRLLLPGFIDVQVNGGGGRLFNSDPSVETIAVMAAAHRRFGTTGLLPTLISDDLGRHCRHCGRRCGHRAAACLECSESTSRAHCSATYARGIHLASKLQAFDDRFIEVLCSDLQRPNTGNRGT